MKRYIAVAAALFVLLCMVTTAAVIGFLLWPREGARPLVSIQSPSSGSRVTMGEPVAVYSVARGATKLTRVEFWVDGVLQSAEQSRLPGGISPFPLAMQWHPPSPGPHTLTVRAFNTQGGRSFASVDVQVVEVADRDGDSVADSVDACPDQPGSEAADGCPDRDNDQIRDADDACPDQPGTREGRGCPTPSGGDRDGDGVADSADACPDQPGTVATRGCPDRDGDGVSDTADTCPDEPGSLEGSGCPGVEDRDGDSVVDGADTCPDELGAPGSAGCPDRDGDGVRDALDLCPDTPGPRDNSGCPPTGSDDTDNDGVDNGTDLAPAEAGSADSGGAPPPGGGVDGDNDMIPDDEEAGNGGIQLAEWMADLGGVIIEGVVPLSELDLETIEFDALQFNTSTALPNGTAVYCYASLGGGAVEQIGPFDSLGQQSWDIAEWSGGANSRRLLVRRSQPLAVSAECYARVRNWLGFEFNRNLGVFRHEHPSLQANEREYDGRVQSGDSFAGDPGQSFHLVYRLCSPACVNYDSQFGVVGAPSLPVAPVLRLSSLLTEPIARWTWDGDRSRLDYFRIYLGEQSLGVLPTQSSALLMGFEPACGTSLEVYMTAVGRGLDGSVLESQRSNTVTWDGPACRRQVRVTFQSVRLGDVGTDENGDAWAGPIDVYFRISGADQELHLQAGHCGIFRWSNCWGVWLYPNTSYSVSSLYATAQREYDGCNTTACMHSYKVPWTDYLVANQSVEDNLRIRVIFHEFDSPSGRDHGEDFFNGVIELRPEEITNGVKTITSGSSTFTVRLEVLESH